MSGLLLALALVASDPSPTESWGVQFAPGGFLHGDYVADPRRPTFGVNSLSVDSSAIPLAGDARWGIQMGSRFGIVQVQTPWFETPIQLDGSIGYLAEFDRDNSGDNLGWDGFFGLDLTWKLRESISCQLGFSHDSSHLGDEYIATSGVTRLGYTREEYRLGIRWQALDTLALYSAYGHAKRVGNADVMKDGRAQAGFEFESRTRLLGDRLAPFVALDLGAFEEDDWDVGINAQLGFVRRPSNGSVWRFGMEYYDGRSTIGEFFQNEERHVSIGIWIDP